METRSKEVEHYRVSRLHIATHPTTPSSKIKDSIVNNGRICLSQYKERSHEMPSILTITKMRTYSQVIIASATVESVKGIVSNREV
jgi:hypothetical protein